MLKLNLSRLFNERGISQPCIYLIKHNIPRHTAQRILSGEHTHLHFTHVETLCKALVCTPNDLLEYIPDKEEGLLENHPLKALKRQSDHFNWLQKTAGIPLPELQQLINQINQQIHQKNSTEE